jgi:hypothetical protein
MFCSPVGGGFEQPDNDIFCFCERAFYPATNVKLFPLRLVFASLSGPSRDAFGLDSEVAVS